MDIFLLFGAPQILQSDNGSEFTAFVISELKLLWPDLLMVHGKPRHPRSQGSAERLNCDVKDMLIAWLGDNKSTDWPVGLKFVQFAKNTSYHTGIKQSPYMTLFGGNPRVGLRLAALPTEMLERMVSEDDLIAAFNTQKTSDDASSAAALNSGINIIQPGSSSSATAGEITPPGPSSSTTEGDIAPPDVSIIQPGSSSSATAGEITPPGPSSSTTEGDIAPPAPSTPSHMDQLQSQRKRARDSLIQQAEHMVKRSRVQHAPGNPGDNVTVPIPMVDRGRGDPRNLMGVIIDRDDNDMYRIAVRAGVLNGKYSRNQFELCIHKLLQITDVSTDEEVALRTAVQRQSLCGGQGFVKCNCAGSGMCKSNRCKCFKAKVNCNSRCHASLSCDNKHK